MQFREYAGDGIFKLDVTETPMSDDLHNPQNVIAESQRITAEAFGAGESYYLVNGTTCGNQAMIIAASVQKSGRSSGNGKAKILIPRNAHKSVMAGLIMSGAEPVYMPVGSVKELGLSGLLQPETVEKILKANPDTDAVFTVSPSYHGFCSDIAALADTAHRRNIPLLVDEAHGAHLYFSSGLPDGALRSGADACAQSMHKTAGALTQASLLHLSKNSCLIDSRHIDSALRMTMSTSPSYPLICSLELARNDLELHGEEYFSKTIDTAERIRDEINQKTGGLFFSPGKDFLKRAGINDFDPCRIIINCDNAGISGFKLKTELWNRFRLDVELADDRNILLLISYGNSGEEAENLLAALKAVASELKKHHAPDKKYRQPETDGLPALPEAAMTPREAYFARSERIPWKEMKGRVTAEAVIPYPPGIPAVYPGEIINEEIYEFLMKSKNEDRHLHGLSDKSLSTIMVCI